MFRAYIYLGPIGQREASAQWQNQGHSYNGGRGVQLHWGRSFRGANNLSLALVAKMVKTLVIMNNHAINNWKGNLMQDARKQTGV